MSLVVGLKMQIASGKEILLPFVQLGRICYLLLNGGQNLAVFCFLFHPLELKLRSETNEVDLSAFHTSWETSTVHCLQFLLAVKCTGYSKHPRIYH